MRKISSVIVAILFAGTVFGQSIWTNPISTVNPNTANPYTTGDVVDPNLTASGIGRGTGIAGAGASNRYAATGWNSVSLDINDYFEFTLTPNASCSINFTDFVYTSQASASGPQTNFAFRSSLDGFTADIGTPTVTGATISLAGAPYQGVSSAVTFRLYAWGASAAAGTFSINDFTFNGTTGCGPVCTPPASQATLFTSSNITNTTADISWTAGSSGNVIVVAHQTSAVNSDPINGTTYSANSIFGSGTQIGTGNYVVYDGTGTSVTVTGLTLGNTYYFAVYEYDPNAGSPCYNIAELTGNITTTGTGTGLQIQSILVDACAVSGNEPLSEMVRFKNGNLPLAIANISIAGAVNGAYQNNKWPNPGQDWHGLVQNSNTASVTAQFDATILAGTCGKLLEPPAGIIPANATVIMICSEYPAVALNDFSNLNDSIYLVYQDTVTSVTSGHFVNQSGGTGLRSLVILDNQNGFRDTVTYDKALLVDVNGNANADDGATVLFDVPGNATYINYDCSAPYVPFFVDAPANTSVCFNGSVNLLGSGSSQYSSILWSGGTGTFTPNNAFATSYTPGAGETSGTVQLYIQLNSNCGTFIKDSLILTINPAPTPTVTASIPSATVCNGSPITLTASGGTNYSWISPVANTNTVTVNPTTSTVYTVNVTNGCSMTPATFSVTVNDLPVINATNTGAYCAKDSIHLSETATTGFTYDWTGPNSFASSVQNPFIANSSAANAGTYSLTVTDNNTCQNSTTTTVVVNALPTFNSSGIIITPATCGLADGDISGVGAVGTNGGNYTYYWTASNGGMITPTDSILTDTTGGVYYFVATEIATGCKDSVSFTIPTAGGPTIPVFAAVSPVCEGAGTTLSLTPGSVTVGATYIWTLGTDTLQNGIDLTSLVLDTAFTGPYNVTVFNGGCGNSGDTTITIKPTPTPTITGTLSFCAGANTVLDASTSSPSTGNSYQWYFNGGPISGETAVTYSATVAGNYQLQVTNAGCDSLSAVTTVSVNSLPVVNTTLAPVVNTPAGCGLSNGSITLSSASGSAPFIYQWTNGAGTSLSSDSVLLNVGAGSYYLVATDNNGCKDSTIATMTAALPPAAATFDPAPSVCEGSTFSLSVSNDLLGATYSWAATGVTTQSGVDLTTITVTNASSINVGVYTVSVTVDACATTSTVTATFNPLPNPVITSDSVAMCTGASIVLDGNPTSGVSYQWLLNTGNISGATSSTLSVNQAGNYSLYVMDGNGCEATSAPFAVSIHAEPSISSTNDQFCLNSAVAALTATSADPNIVYTWDNGAGTVTGSTIPLNSLVAGATTYTVVGVDQNGCDDTVQVVATILAPPTFGFSANDFCLNAAGTLSADNAGLTYSWDNGTVTTGTSVTVPATTVGTTTYSVTGTDGNGCETINNIDAIVHDLPIIEILNEVGGDTTICGSTPIDLLASGASSYVWSTTETTNPITVGTTGTYSVTGTDAFGCVNSTFINVTTAPGPVIGTVFGMPTICNGYQAQLSIDSISGSTYSWTNSLGTVLSTDTTAVMTTAGAYTLTVTNACGISIQPLTIAAASISASFDADTTLGLAPLQVQFTNTSSGADSYYWDFGNGDILGTALYNPVADLNQIYTVPGTYTAYLLATNSLNYCSVSTTVEIIVLAQEIGIVIPNVFSPNNDELNDFFGVQSYGIKEFSCTIFNRWGIQVADLKNLTDKWVPDANTSEGTYFYMVKAKGLDGKDYSREGYVLLVR